jgi:APA family basic amino acid/polyamine antiporter
MRDRSAKLGMTTLVCLVIANMIGSGLYTSSCWSLASLHDARWVLLVWLVGGTVACCGAVGYGALADRIPVSGGEYLYLSRLMHPAIGFLAGWISLVAGFTAPIAAAALVFGTYAVGSDLQDTRWPIGLALAIIALAAVAHMAHVQMGAWFQNSVVLVKLVGLLVFIGWAMLQGPKTGWQSGVISLNGPPLEFGSAAWMVASMESLVWISLSYTGFNAAIYMAGEAVSVPRILSRSMGMATLAVTGLYLVLNAIFLYAAPADDIKNNPQFVASAARAIGGSGLDTLTRWIITLSSATSVLGLLMTGPRVYAQMSRDGVMPGFLSGGTSRAATAQPESSVPRIAIGAQALLSMLVVMAVGLEKLISYLGLTLTACGALAVSCLFWMPTKMPGVQPARFYERLCAAIFIGTTLALLAVAWRVKPYEFWACVTTFSVGGGIYALRQVISWRRSA